MATIGKSINGKSALSFQVLFTETVMDMQVNPQDGEPKEGSSYLNKGTLEPKIRDFQAADIGDESFSEERINPAVLNPAQNISAEEDVVIEKLQVLFSRYNILHKRIGSFFYVQAEKREVKTLGIFDYYVPIPFEESSLPAEIKRYKSKIIYTFGLNGECFGNREFGFFYSPDTEAVLLALQEIDWDKKSYLSCGCGQGHHPIMASKLGAAKVYGLDKNGNSLYTAEENAKLNGTKIKFFQGEFEYFDYSQIAPVDVASACILDCGINRELEVLVKRTKAATFIISGNGCEKLAEEILKRYGYRNFKTVEYKGTENWGWALIAN